MEPYLRVLHLDAASGFYRIEKFPVGAFFGPVDLGLHLSKRFNSLNIGTGLFAGSIFPGSNRMVFTGFSPCWGSFYISSMGGAGLVFDDLGINLLAIRNRAPAPSLLCLNRVHGEEVQIDIAPVDCTAVWGAEPGGIYSMMRHALDRFGDRYADSPRVLAVGPAALATDMGAIASAPIKDGEISHIDTWAGRGGFGSKLLQEHGIAAIVYGGTVIDEDFRDRKVADEWFQNKFQKKLAAKDMEATTKYRFDPKFDTGGTFGVNYAGMGGRIIAFNYRSIYMTEDERRSLHSSFILDHYLKQFNDETIKTKSQKTCGEPCAAVCKKYRDEYKKDYEPYQTMGPLCGVFDQRAAERLVRHADMLGFDSISIGGTLAWLMECLDAGHIAPAEIGVSGTPRFSPTGFSVVVDSAHNAELGIAILDSIVGHRGLLERTEGMRKLARGLARDRGRALLDPFIYTANARTGWMVPNQYWTPGVLAPMPIMGKYYMHYGAEFHPPRELGRQCAKRLIGELVMDNAGFCRFHRTWAEEMIPELVGTLYGLKDEFVHNVTLTAGRINSRNTAQFWEAGRCIDLVESFMIRRRDVENDTSPELVRWIDKFKADRAEAALEYWFDMLKGIHESLKEF